MKKTNTIKLNVNIITNSNNKGTNSEKWNELYNSIKVYIF